MKIRERFALNAQTIKESLENLDDYPAISEAVILSTCNRSEIYAVSEESVAGGDDLRRMWRDASAGGGDFEAYLYEYASEDCIRHLFRVAGGLNSLILGEGQILSQVKAAYAMAKEAMATDTVLNTLFNRAICVGKRIRTETRIAYNSVSVSFAAVELAEKKLGTLDGRNALIFGAGKMAHLTAKHLLARHVGKIYVANRHLERAEELAKEIGGEALPLAQVMEAMLPADIIVTSTGAPHYVLKSRQTRQLMAERGGRELFIIDIAVPRDVEPSVGEISGVTLYNIDDLEAVVDKNIKLRQSEAAQAEKIVEEELETTLAKFQYLTFRPLMTLISERSERIRQRELKRVRSKLANLNETEWRQIDNLSHMIVRKLLRVPMMKLTSAAGTEQENFYAEACKALFKLEKSGEAGKNGYHRYRYARQ